MTSQAKKLLAVLLLGGHLATASATVLLHEPFSYANGSLVTVGSARWQTFSGTTGQITVVDSRVTMNLSNSEDVQTFLAPPASTDIVYAGFTVNFSTLPPAGGSYFTMFKGSGNSTDFRARVFALTGGAAAGKFRLGLSSTGSSLNVTNPTDLSLNTDYRVVVRLWNATGTASLWIDPADEAAPSVTTAETPSSSTVAAFALRQGGGPGQLTLDDLMLGETFGAVVVTNAPPPPVASRTPVLSVLCYNTKGNSIADWTTNSPQVQAIGRQVAYLAPDIVTFQEIPMTNSGWAQMPSFVAAYLPGYYLATNSGHDGFIRSAILSRFPITRSQSWLQFTDLKPFGYTNTSTPLADNFTRDLFEAEIVVPDFEEPLHVFTAHLKSGSGDAAGKRAAEAGVVSNFFVNVFLPTNGHRPYLLTGDLNEDIAQPTVNDLPPIRRLVNAATGLQLTTPRNPVTDGWRTFSIREVSGLARRYDYILPGALLHSNIASNLVFRSDVLTPLPPNLFSNDSRNASDHLPVMMWFGNPYPHPFRLLSLTLTNTQFTLRWETMSNRIYGVEASTNLVNWQPLATNLLATATNLTFTTNQAGDAQFLRVYRVP